MKGIDEYKLNKSSKNSFTCFSCYEAPYQVKDTPLGLFMINLFPILMHACNIACEWFIVEKICIQHSEYMLKPLPINIT